MSAPPAPAAPRTVLVTGATGFVGRRVTATLAAAGHRVRPAGLARAGDGILRLPLEPGTAYADAVDGIDTVVHLAGRVHVLNETAADPLAAFRAVNVQATLELAEAAARAEVRHFVFMSSVAVMGSWRGRPFVDDDTPAPRTAYGISKHEAEQELGAFARKTGMALTVLRPPLVYGPDPVGRFAQLVHLVARGVPLPLGGIANSRSLIGAGNLADLVCAVVEAPSAEGTYLVSDGRDLSTPELATAIAAAFGRGPRLFPMPDMALRLGAALVRRPGLHESLAGSLTIQGTGIGKQIGWRPPISLEAELAETARRCREQAAQNRPWRRRSRPTEKVHRQDRTSANREIHR